MSGPGRREDRPGAGKRATATSSRSATAGRSGPPRSGSTKSGPGRSTAHSGDRPPRPLNAPSLRRPGSSQVWRLSALALVLVLLGVFLFPTISGYVDQRREVTQLEQQIEAQRGDIDDLQAELQDWSNPDFIERNARDRLRFVRPGETSFTVLDDTGAVLVEPLPGVAAVTNDVHESRPWYGEVWESVKTANDGLPETVTDGG
ncbi:MAG: septum formation initiator family protein [Ornithinimicrobium sp.]